MKKRMLEILGKERLREQGVPVKKEAVENSGEKEGAGKRGSL